MCPYLRSEMLFLGTYMDREQYKVFFYRHRHRLSMVGRWRRCNSPSNRLVVEIRVQCSFQTDKKCRPCRLYYQEIRLACRLLLTPLHKSLTFEQIVNVRSCDLKKWSENTRSFCWTKVTSLSVERHRAIAPASGNENIPDTFLRLTK